MHIEIYQSTRTPKAKTDTITVWYWHFKNKGRITADAEAFPTKANAMRAAKAVVKAVVKEMCDVPPNFTVVMLDKTRYQVTWG